MEVTTLKRTFVVKINGKEEQIDDPNPDMSVEEVKKYLSGLYPEITNAGTSTPEIKKNKAVYSFNTSIATKG